MSSSNKPKVTIGADGSIHVDNKGKSATTAGATIDRDGTIHIDRKNIRPGLPSTRRQKNRLRFRIVSDSVFMMTGIRIPSGSRSGPKSPESKRAFAGPGNEERSN